MSGLSTVIRDYRRAARAAAAADRRPRRQWRRVRAEGEADRYGRLIEQEDWAALREAGVAERGARRNDMAEMVRRQDRLARLALAIDEAAGAARAFRSDARNAPEPPVPLSDELRAALRGAGGDPDAIEARLTEDRESPRGIDRDMRRTLAGMIDDVDAAHATALAAYAGARLAEMVAASALATAPTPADEIEELVADGWRETRSALRDERPRSVVWAAAASLARTAERHLIAAAENASDGSIDSADRARATLRAAVAGRHLAMLARWPESVSDLDDWREAAGGSWRSAYRWPAKRAIGPLLRNPAARHGEDLVIEGVVGAVDVDHVRGKPVSWVTLSDGDHEAVAVIEYIKVDSTGLVPGTPARLAGTWRKERGVGGDGPGLAIDRIAYADLAQESFADFVNWQIRTSYEPVSHGIAAGFGWKAGADGAGNQLRYRTWRARPPRR